MLLLPTWLVWLGLILRSASTYTPYAEASTTPRGDGGTPAACRHRAAEVPQAVAAGGGGYSGGGYSGGGGGYSGSGDGSGQGDDGGYAAAAAAFESLDGVSSTGGSKRLSSRLSDEEEQLRGIDLEVQRASCGGRARVGCSGAALGTALGGTLGSALGTAPSGAESSSSSSTAVVGMPFSPPALAEMGTDSGTLPAREGNLI